MESVVFLVLDLFGTAVFAATGAVKGVRCKLDVFGVTVLACCVGVGGGMIRDSILGATPAAALQNWTYLGVCIAIGLTIFLTAQYWMHLRNLILFGDAIGLGVFTAIGAGKGIQFDVSFIGVILCGVFTAIGGGIIRDVLAGEVPAVLRNDFYATASLLGGILYYFLYRAELNWFVNFLLTAGFVILIRLVAIHYRLQLPQAHRMGRWNQHSSG
ncbi:MAG: trimeric intracellular cation channel family protein [Lentisphaeria bacterium]|nr:trimeric intracellular cation channel family protein [Lentisphaeria bacterium]